MGGGSVHLIFDFHQVEQFTSTVTPFGEGGSTAETHLQHCIFQHRQGGKQLEELESHPDRSFSPDGKSILAELFYILAANKNLALGRAIQPRDHVN